jgi:acetolactate synthase-1/2/3 large subunit
MVQQWQDIFYENRYAHTIQVNPDFVKFGEAMHIKAIRVTRQEDLREKMEEFINYNEGPILMEAVVTKGEHVLPMVPAGKALHQFLVHGNIPTYPPLAISIQNHCFKSRLSKW